MTVARSIERGRIVLRSGSGSSSRCGADDDLIERRERSLCGCVVASQRFDDVADELEADRLRLGRGIEVHDAAADAELTVLVDGILR